MFFFRCNEMKKVDARLSHLNNLTGNPKSYFMNIKKVISMHLILNLKIIQYMDTYIVLINHLTAVLKKKEEMAFSTTFIFVYFKF